MTNVKYEHRIMINHGLPRGDMGVMGEDTLGDVVFLFFVMSGFVVFYLFQNG